MPSALTWLDYSEQDRRRVLDVLHALQERETRDELGLGLIRDGFANAFFPGTSVVQTRARYFLFIPWIYRALEARQTPPRQVPVQLRQIELALIEALSQSERPAEGAGIIGIDARGNLQRWPSNVYWQGLGSLGI